MSGGATRRFPRTAQAIPEARPTIEREKIKHRRPNDHLFDDQRASFTPPSIATDDVDDLGYADDGFHDDGEADWTDPEEDDPETSAWDEEFEDDWALEGDDDRGIQALQDDVYDDGVDESGVVWEDDDYSDQAPVDDLQIDDPDEVAFGAQGAGYGSAAPEMELAGRRDVRPKPPRPALPPNAPTPRQPRRMQRLRGQQPKPRSRRSEIDWSASDEPDLIEPAANEPSLGSGRRSVRPVGAAHSASPPAENSRFSRTRATLAPTGGSDETVLQPSRRAPPQRRRKAPASPRLDQTFAARYARRRRNGLIAIVLVALLAVGGWFGYQAIGPDGIKPTIDRLTALIPLPSSSRTAADTPFGGQGSAESVAAEQALSDLEERVRQQDGGGLAPAQTASPADPATARSDGPPIPQFKPPLGATRSLSGKVPANGVDETANGETGEPSIFDQLRRFFSSG
ncbi:MAG: nucleolar 14 family protein [Alphaproteobacteria bacterium]|nr:nucleolar 14 family protein [Alphaproteobacteria bacterium]